LRKEEVRLSDGELLWITGPASIFISAGSVRILGASYGGNSRLVVPRFRSYTLASLGNTSLAIMLGEGGEYRLLEDSGVMVEWENTAVRAVRRGGTILILGPVDSGKTSFAALISNTALGEFLKPAVIDGDVGQADIGPPGFVSMAYPEKPVLWLRELRAGRMVFVGQVSPTPDPGMVASALHLLRRKAESSIVVVDTDGWMDSVRALQYKYMLMEMLEPSTVILLGGKHASFFEKASRILGSRLEEAPSPPSIRPRSREDRRILRREAYKKYLENADVLEVSLDEVAILGSCFYAGKPLSEAELRAIEDLTGLRIIAASRSDKLVIVAEDHLTPELAGRIAEAVGQAVVIEAGLEKGLLASIIGNDPAEQMPAVLEKIDYRENKVFLRTSWKGEIRGIHIGRIRLKEDYVEERITGCPI